ncbi:MAG TPA: hypothetical protein VMK16_02970 [Acidimicrobiales bacterium]|nr:hypothetical protein [Acidimicrobiales bacterium]
MSRLRPHLALALVLALGTVGFVACGGGDDSGKSASNTGGGSTESSAPDSSSSGSTGGGSGNGKGVAVEAWAGEVCGAVGTWLDGINASNSQLNEDVQGLTDLSQIRDVLVGFLNDSVSLTDDMINGVKDAGAPDVENGEQLSADLVAALSPVKDTFQKAANDAKSLPTSDPTAFSQAATKLGQAITDSQSEFSSSFDALQEKYDDPALNKAFDEVPACAQLGK